MNTHESKQDDSEVVASKIVDAIIQGKLITAACCENEGHGIVLVWAASVYEQLGAIMRDHKI